jgi:hypothetical protein
MSLQLSFLLIFEFILKDQEVAKEVAQKAFVGF